MTRLTGLPILLVILLLGAGYGVYAWMQAQRDTLPDGIVRGNGRIEVDQVDIAPKFAGRVEEILVAEGDMVVKGQLVARMDADELEAAFDRAQAQVSLAREKLREAEATVIQRRSELRLAEHELRRAMTLIEKGHISEAVFEQRQSTRDVAEATLKAAEAHVDTVRREIAAAEADARRILSQIEDAALSARVDGRVLYRLAELGEVVSAGEPILTLLDLEDVYMEIFLPALEAGRVPLGAEARIVLDVLPDYAIPAEVSFVSPEAQFTPKQVETVEEREKLVFRVRVRIPSELVAERIDYVKTGIRGEAYVKLRPSVTWPAELDRRIPPELFE